MNRANPNDTPTPNDTTLPNELRLPGDERGSSHSESLGKLFDSCLKFNVDGRILGIAKLPDGGRLTGRLLLLSLRKGVRTTPGQLAVNSCSDDDTISPSP